MNDPLGDDEENLPPEPGYVSILGTVVFCAFIAWVIFLGQQSLKFIWEDVILPIAGVV